jgi:hypothetical protein
MSPLHKIVTSLDQIRGRSYSRSFNDLRIFTYDAGGTHLQSSSSVLAANAKHTAGLEKENPKSSMKFCK